MPKIVANFKKIGPLKEKDLDSIDNKLTEIQDNIQETFTGLGNYFQSLINSGVTVVIESLSASSSRTYEHNLNRDPSGFFVIDCINNTNAYPKRLSWNKKFITIYNPSTTNAMDVTLLVF